MIPAVAIKVKDFVRIKLKIANGIKIIKKNLKYFLNVFPNIGETKNVDNDAK